MSEMPDQEPSREWNAQSLREFLKKHRLLEADEEAEQDESKSDDSPKSFRVLLDLSVMYRPGNMVRAARVFI